MSAPKSPKSLTTVKILQGTVFVGVLVLVVIHQIERGRFGGAPALGARRVTRSTNSKTTIKLHGSTPTMAWSPDGRKLAFNAAFEYYGFSRQRRTQKSALGVFVYNVKRGKMRRVTTAQGYHPLWLSNARLAWGHSPYESGKSGLYVARLKRRGKPTIKRIGSFKGVYHTLPGKKGHIVFYSGWPEYKRWVWVSPKRAKLHKIKLTKKKRRPRPRPPRKKGYYRSRRRAQSSWDRPKGHFKNQCLQKAGKASVTVDSSGNILLTTASQTLQIPERAYRFYNYGRRGCAVSGHCGSVKPCLSPKGRYLAYFGAKVKKDTYHLHIIKVPR